MHLDLKLNSCGVSMEALDETQVAIAGLISPEGKGT